MYYLALAADYDGTLADRGHVEESTIERLRRLRETGRRLIMVTGREMADLKRVFAHTELFERIVAENGALIHTPATGEEEVLSPAPDPHFVRTLVERGVEPLSVGNSIVATWEPHQTLVLEVIKELGLELEVIFNKGAVMVLPTGVNKATGLAAALAQLGLSPHNVVGVGDAQNDHAFLRACGCSVAVANALDAVKGTADLVLAGSRGAGVEELIDLVMEHDYDLGPSPRNRTPVGEEETDRQAELSPRDVALVAGSSGFGKSTLATALTERFAGKGFQFCIFDPEGDYDDLEDAVAVGDAASAPENEQVMKLLARPETNVVVNTLGMTLAERPDFFASLYPEISGLRARTGRPHWLIVDEAHHLVPRQRDGASLALSSDASGTILITVHPDTISEDVLRMVTVVIAIGPEAPKVVETFCERTGRDVPFGLAAPEREQVIYWRPDSDIPPRVIKAAMPRQSHKRHTRKYAEGTLDEQRSFYFRGPGGALNLRAQNLLIFAQMAEGIDDDTFEFHRHAGDFSRWFREQIGDDELADVAAAAEADASLSADESRARIVAAVRERYTAPASAEAAA
jgi:HAD superfamily hydrolase (TIGR01484 family)